MSYFVSQTEKQPPFLGSTVISLTVSPDGRYDDLSLLGCLPTGSGCLTGNQLTANFRISSVSLNSVNVPAEAIPGITPSLDLLEDEGVTGIQGAVTSYSYLQEPRLLWRSLLALLSWNRLGPRRFRPARTTGIL